MARKERIVCECGGLLQRPIPKTCPHCNAEIIAVRQRRWPLYLSILIVAGLVAGLMIYVWWLADRVS